MTGLPRISIDETAVNDVIVVLDALLDNGALTDAIDDPAALYTRYRAELRLFRQLFFADDRAPAPQPAPPTVPQSNGTKERTLPAGSILR